MTINRCAIFGSDLKPEHIHPTTGFTVDYETPLVGRVKIGIPAYTELLTGAYERYIIAGICKHRFLEGKEPILIDSEFIKTGYKNLNPPVDFEEKAYSLLKYLYATFGKENRKFNLNSTMDFPLAYASPEEFIRVVDYLEKESFISTGNVTKTKNGNFYVGARVEKLGKEEAKKVLPKMPLFGLISQQIITGSYETDEKINHARNLFFDEPRTMDKMRSACEALSYVLEPLRKDLEDFFNSKDISDFFQLVNSFDIRHNKPHTKDLIYPEQLEWVFYSLLNTINTYTKLKSK